MLAARITDSTYGVCSHSSHDSPITTGGMIIVGSSNVVINGLPAVRLLDTVISDCGHTSIMIEGSSKVMTNGLPAVRMLDSFSGVYVGIVIGSSNNVFIS